MDICNNPSLIPIHGFLAGKNPNVMPLTPLFALSKTHLHADILGIPFEHWVNASAETHVPFEEKKSDKLLWRGSNTGGYYSASTPWRRTHRVRAVKLANALDEEEMRLLPGGEGMEGQPRTKGGKGKKHPSLEERSQVVDRGLVNVRWMDIAFTGFPLREYRLSVLAAQALVPRFILECPLRRHPGTTTLISQLCDLRSFVTSVANIQNARMRTAPATSSGRNTPG